MNKAIYTYKKMVATKNVLYKNTMEKMHIEKIEKLYSHELKQMNIERKQ